MIQNIPGGLFLHPAGLPYSALSILSSSNILKAKPIGKMLLTKHSSSGRPMNPYVFFMSLLIYMALTGYLTAWYIRVGKNGSIIGRKIGSLVTPGSESDFIRIRRGHILSAVVGFTCDISGTLIMEIERIRGRIKFHPVPPALDWFHLITAQGALYLFLVVMTLGFLKRKGAPISRFHYPVAKIFFLFWFSSSISGWFYRVH